MRSAMGIMAMVVAGAMSVSAPAFADNASLTETGKALPQSALRNVAVGPQYDTTHVYIPSEKLDAFVDSFVTTFGGKASQRAVFTVTPTPSKTASQYVQTPVGMISVFGFQTPIPYPFGNERTGYLVTDMDQALAAARAAGADVIVDSFDDPIGRDAVIQWPGGLMMQLYWHIKAPTYAPLARIQDNRVYVSRYAAGHFVRSWLKFSHGKVVSDVRHADAGVIGRPGETLREIRIQSNFGKMVVFVTDGKLPFPFGWETTGYDVDDLDATLAKATQNGAKVLSPVYKSATGRTAVVEFPGGYIAEIHDEAH
jgi:predicted enzyme related to lactoylglutathione lyase